MEQNGACSKTRNSPCKYLDAKVNRKPLKCPYNGNVQECLDGLIHIGMEYDSDAGWQTFVFYCLELKDYGYYDYVTIKRPGKRVVVVPIKMYKSAKTGRIPGIKTKRR